MQKFRALLRFIVVSIFVNFDEISEHDFNSTWTIMPNNSVWYG